MSKHPKGFYLISAAETFSSFGFYGVRSILTVYMLLVLSFTSDLTSIYYGVFSGLIYLTPLLGGYISDRYWGNNRAIIIGILLMSLGAFTISYSASLYAGPLNVHNNLIFSAQEIIFLFGLLFMILGHGFFKPNNSTMLVKLYPSKSELVEAAFTLFYMILNIGAIFSILIIGFIVGEDPVLFKYGFFLAGIVMLAGLVLFIALKNKYLVSPTGAPIGGKIQHEEDVENGLAEEDLNNDLLKKYGLQDLDLESDDAKAVEVKNKLSKLSNEEKDDILNGDLTRIEKERVYVILLTILFGIFFFVAFEQMGISLTYFARDYVSLNVGNLFEIPPQCYQSLNPIFVAILAPLFVLLWSYLYKHKLNISIAHKIGIGLIVLAIGFLLMCLPGSMIDSGTSKVSPIWLIVIYLFISISELTFIPNCQALLSRLAPRKFLSFLMGGWFGATAIANVIAGFLSALYPDPSAPVPYVLGFPITGFYEFFMIFAILSAIGGAIALILNKKIVKWMHWEFNLEES